MAELMERVKDLLLSLDAVLAPYGIARWHFFLALGLVVLAYLFVRGRSDRESIFGLGSGTKDIEKHTLEANKYVALFSKDKSEAERLHNYEAVVNSYYDLATDFYEYGWGSSFHFAQRSEVETLAASIARHEHFLASKLQLGENSTVVDIGCGIGGPAREISRFSGAAVTGLNNNEYQVSRANILTQRQHISPKKCNFVKGDFMDQPFKDNSFDAAYAIEATCHAPDRVGCYEEILRVVKPGGLFACYEWATTDNYDEDVHKDLLDDILIGNGLPGAISTREVLDAVSDAGWEVLEYRDLAEPTPHFPIPWYEPLAGGFNLRNFRTTSVGKFVTSVFCWVFETLRVLPSGTYETQQFLIRGANGLVAGGQTDTFTPMFFFLARKPEKAASPRSKGRKSTSKRATRSSSRSPRRRR